MLKSKEFSRKETHYFVGFWAYKDFIHPYIPEVREILRYRSKNEKYELFKHKICSYSNSASIHVRRTDYLENKHLFKMLDINYYSQSIDYLNKKYNDIKYFLFTDDPDWCKDVFDDVQNVELVSGCGFSDIEEFELMRYCSHNIIANSTFSWWAACLNANENKTIILPENWFVNLEFQDIYVKGVSALRLNNGVYF
jgi:hypothetical protein